MGAAGSSRNADRTRRRSFLFLSLLKTTNTHAGGGGKTLYTDCSPLAFFLENNCSKKKKKKKKCCLIVEWEFCDPPDFLTWPRGVASAWDENPRPSSGSPSVTASLWETPAGTAGDLPATRLH